MDGRVSIPWKIGGGNIIIEAVGGDVTISSDSSSEEARSQVVTFRTDIGNASAELLVSQKPLESVFNTGKWRMDLKWINKTHWKMNPSK